MNEECTSVETTKKLGGHSPLFGHSPLNLFWFGRPPMASAKAPPLAAAVASAQRRRDEATPFLVLKDTTASPWSRFPRAAKGVCAFLGEARSECCLLVCETLCERGEVRYYEVLR